MPHQDTVFRQVAKLVPWAVTNALTLQYQADKGVRRLSTRDLLLTLVYAHLSNASSLRVIEANLENQDGRRYHSCLPKARRSTLAEALATRPAAVFSGVLAALIPKVTRKLRQGMGECVRLIDSTSIRLNTLSADWSRFSAKVCGVKAHIIYDPDAECPLYLDVTPSRINDITAAKTMPVDRGATYVFDLGYYDYPWWRTLDDAGCRIVTRLKKNTPLQVVKTLRLPKDAGHILTDQIGFLPERQCKSRRNPMGETAVREIKVKIDTGKIIRIVTNDLDAPAKEIAALYKRRWAIELFFRWIKQMLKLRHYYGTSENAVRIQITVALIAFILIRLAHAAQSRIVSLTIFASLLQATVLDRYRIDNFGKQTPIRHRPPTQCTAQACLF